MDGASRNSLTDLQGALAELLAADGIDVIQVGEDLLAISGVLGGSVVLRRAATDPSRAGRERGGLIDRLFAGRISDAAQQIARRSVEQRWTRDAHLTSALESLAIRAFLIHSQRQQRLTLVEEELFRFQRIADQNPKLQAALTDSRASQSARSSLVKALLSDKVAPETLRLVLHAVATPYTRFDRAIDSYLRVAAEVQSHVMAVVTSAAPLSRQQHRRMTAALSTQYGREVHLSAVIDPDVIGGVRVEIGDEVIEGTISTRLAQARRHVTR